MPAALIVGHPGHELRLFRWLELTHPVVFILTDGSGNTGRSRVPASLQVLSATGCTPGSIMGEFTDADVYAAILKGDVDRMAGTTVQLAAELIALRVSSLISDAVEFYNPTHDLCSVVANLAVKLANRFDHRIGRYDYGVTDDLAEGNVLHLTAEELDRKMSMAMSMEALRRDVSELIARLGVRSMQREVLRPLVPAEEMVAPTAKPYYELRGEAQVAAGLYEGVLRYEDHFVPFVRSLVAEIEARGPALLGSR